MKGKKLWLTLAAGILGVLTVAAPATVPVLGPLVAALVEALVPPDPLPEAVGVKSAS